MRRPLSVRRPRPRPRALPRPLGGVLDEGGGLAGGGVGGGGGEGAGGSGLGVAGEGVGVGAGAGGAGGGGAEDGDGHVGRAQADRRVDRRPRPQPLVQLVALQPSQSLRLTTLDRAVPSDPAM